MAGSLKIIAADITQLETDCIVNAANSRLAQGGGVCGAIFRAAGAAELRQACEAIGSCPTGSAVLTPGFRLKAEYIAHAAGPIWQGGSHGEPEQLSGCYRSALEKALQKGCRSIAFPLISSGIYGYPRRQAWEIAIRTILDFLEAGNALDVTISVLTEEDCREGNSILKLMSRKEANT